METEVDLDRIDRSIGTRDDIQLNQNAGVNQFLGVGIGAVCVAPMALWLALHRRSPLRKQR